MWKQSCSSAVNGSPPLPVSVSTCWTRPPATSWRRSPTATKRTRSPRWTRRPRRARPGPTTAPRVRGEALRKAWELMTERADELAKLISLENGKALVDAKGEVTYAAEFFRWFAEEAVRGGGRGRDRPVRRQPHPGRPPAGRRLRAGHPVELPGRDGHPQDRPGAGRRLHRGPQAGQRHPADRARDGRHPGRGRGARGRGQRAAVAQLGQGRLGDAARIRGSGSSPSPARPRSAGSCSPRRPRTSSTPRWSWAATRRSWSSPTPTWTPRSRAR